VDVIAMLNAYWAVTVPVVVREHGGLIERFAGDAVMVVFNAAGDRLDHAERAVDAALGMQRAAELARQGRPDWPRFRAGVNTGTAVVGNVGTDEQRSFAAIGDTINVAARLQAVAEPGQVVVSAATTNALSEEHELRGLGPRELKGKDQPVDAYVVLS
jgi:class 3 adenylate cyclase